MLKKFIRGLASENTRVEGDPVRKLEEAFNRGITTDMLVTRLVLKPIL